MAFGPKPLAFGASRTIREIVGDTANQLDQLNRLGRVGARTRVSFGLLLDEQAERAPDDVVLLFEDRAHTHGAVKERVDNVVAGLLDIGVRQGERVGVLMQTRPSALTVVAALNRHHKFIRGRIAPALDLKFAPDLKFFVDNTFEEFGKIDALLRSDRVQRDLNKDEDEE